MVDYDVIPILIGPSTRAPITSDMNHLTWAREPGPVRSPLRGTDKDGLERPRATNLVVVIYGRSLREHVTLAIISIRDHAQNTTNSAISLVVYYVIPLLIGLPVCGPTSLIMYHVGEGTRPSPFLVTGNGHGRVTEPKGDHWSGPNLGMILNNNTHPYTSPSSCDLRTRWKLTLMNMRPFKTIQRQNIKIHFHILMKDFPRFPET